MTDENESKLKEAMYAEVRECAASKLAGIVRHEVKCDAEGVRDALAEVMGGGDARERAEAVLAAAAWKWACLETWAEERLHAAEELVKAEAEAAKAEADAVKAGAAAK